MLAHIDAAGGWIGIDVVIGVLVGTAMFGGDERAAAIALQALDLFAVGSLLVAGLLTLTTGGGPRVRHEVRPAALLVGGRWNHPRPRRARAGRVATRGRRDGPRRRLRAEAGTAPPPVENLVYPPVVSSAALVVATMLAVGPDPAPHTGHPHPARPRRPHVTTADPVAELLFSGADTPIITDPATVMPWTTARDQLAAAPRVLAGHRRPDGRPHVMPVLAVWFEIALHVATRPTSRKGRNLAGNDDLQANETDLVAAADTLLLGRVTFNDFAGHRPHVARDPDAPGPPATTPAHSTHWTRSWSRRRARSPTGPAPAAGPPSTPVTSTT